MKNYTIIACLAFTIITACKKDTIKVKFNMDYAFNFTVPAGVPASPISIPTPDITTNSSSTFSNNNTSSDKVEEVKLTSMVLNITAPQGATFNFLKSIEIFINANGLPEEKLAYFYHIGTSIGSTLNIDVSDMDMAEYIKKDAYSIRVKAVTDELTNQDIDVKADMVFAVVAAPLK